MGVIHWFPSLAPLDSFMDDVVKLHPLEAKFESDTI